MKMRESVPLVLLLVCLVWAGKDHKKVKKSAEKDYSTGKCTVDINSCSYQVNVVKKDCMYRDAGFPVYPPKAENEVIEEVGGEAVQKLDNLESKLTKMMEGLSIRSLRHIRQIRHDISEITENINSLKSSQALSRQKRHHCPEGFIKVGTWPSCFSFSKFNATWDQAREYCSAMGADLLTLDSVKEAYILELIIKGNKEYQIPTGWWTSGNYIGRMHKWMWTTKLHIKPISFDRWAPGEPDARSTMHCMLLYKHASYRWHDAMCKDRHHYICEIAL